ncbi:CMRF35-like molecule 5 isoform X2 [Boleophthalmus pectinirostris]|uniref:CMRF35-like molecule 5 isoform X2 n=1 Tax=Boleophthalmus pectinirostris TaxID=150288 RepID=UPI00242B3A13|nr:CMRF35-like molecule 5 isoform X2 [Boleophthalmus pectinirostris]
MNMCSLLMLFVVLCHGRLLFSKTETKVIEATEGHNFTAQCLLYFNGNKKIFCQNDCKGKEDTLVETANNRLQNGRYGIEVIKESHTQVLQLNVIITNVRRSDAGSYTCGLEHGEISTFILKVISVETPTPGLTLGAAPTTSLHNVTPAQTTQRTQEASEVTSSQQPQEEHNSSTLSVVLQYVAVSVTTILIIVSGSILIWCWKRKTNRPTAAADDCETPEYENYRVAAVKESADCIYQNLPVDNMDPNQTYSNI